MISEMNMPRLKVNRSLDAKSGNVTIVSHQWDGADIPHVELSGPMADRLTGLAMIQKDLWNALRWTQQGDALLSDTSPGEGLYVETGSRDVADLVKALFVAALSFYAKSFSEAKGRRAQMQRDWLDEEYREAHDIFIEYRHNFVAHSGDKKVESAKSYLLLIPDAAEGPYRLRAERLQPDAVQTTEPELRSLIRHAISKVEARYNELAQKITRDVVEAKGHEFWVAAAKERQVVKLERPRLDR